MVTPAPPIFNENKKQLKGDLAVTTEELFGKVCHVYNLRDALEDQAVLPFNVEHVTTIGKDTLITRDPRERNPDASKHVAISKAAC